MQTTHFCSRIFLLLIYWEATMTFMNFSARVSFGFEASWELTTLSSKSFTYFLSLLKCKSLYRTDNSKCSVEIEFFLEKLKLPLYSSFPFSDVSMFVGGLKKWEILLSIRGCWHGRQKVLRLSCRLQCRIRRDGRQQTLADLRQTCWPTRFQLLTKQSFLELSKFRLKNFWKYINIVYLSHQRQFLTFEWCSTPSTCLRKLRRGPRVGMSPLSRRYL